MRFAPGQFFGDRNSRRCLPGVELADMRPTVPKHEVCTHTHEDAHLLVLHSGAYASTARGMPTVCVQPAVIVNPPGTEHRDCFESLENARFLTISVDAQAWRQATAATPLPSHARRLSPLALPAAYRLWRELLQWEDVSALSVESELQELLVHATRPNGDAQDVRVAGWLARARERLDEDAGSVPGIAELAREADLHPVYFARAFRRAYGCSPGEYLRRGRVEAAIAAVCGSARPLAEIALRTGYSDQSHMTHALRQALGLSPLALRRLSRLQVANLQERRRRRLQAASIANQELPE